LIEIKNTKIGLILLLSGAIIYSSTLISASIYSQVLTQEGIGWNKQYGVFGTAIREIGTLPTIITILLGLAGLIFIVVSDKKD